MRPISDAPALVAMLMKHVGETRRRAGVRQPDEDVSVRSQRRARDLQRPDFVRVVIGKEVIIGGIGREQSRIASAAHLG